MKRRKTLVEYVTHTEYVNTQKKICVSVLDFRICLNKLPNWSGMLDYFEPLNIYLNNFAVTLEHDPVQYGSKSYVNFTVRGIAKCNDNDEFNEETGKHIALTRAQAKAFATAERFYTGFFKVVYDNICRPYERLAYNSFWTGDGELAHADELAGLSLTEAIETEDMIAGDQYDGPYTAEGVPAEPLKAKQVTTEKA
jgi:hypothetical protein